MNEVNCVIETKGNDMALALQVMEVTPEQLGNIRMLHYLQSDYAGMLLASGVFVDCFSSSDACAEI